MDVEKMGGHVRSQLIFINQEQMVPQESLQRK